MVQNCAPFLATTHHPSLPQATTMPARKAADPAGTSGVEAEDRRYRETLTQAEPDILVMVGSDHFHQLSPRQLSPVPDPGNGAALRRDLLQRGDFGEFDLPPMCLGGQ